jgi:uncharacterized protein (DUF2252 family)
MSSPLDLHDTQTFLAPRASRRQRYKDGALLRQQVPLETHATLDDGDRDPVALLRSQEGAREAGLVPIRYERMAASPFAFLRGAALVMADDLARVPRTGTQVQLCGDAHVANFGMFAAPDRRLVFDLNDFDETHPGPFEWDVKRLVASVAVAARHVGLKGKKQRRAAVATAASYRAAIARLAASRTLDVWYARLDFSDLREALRGTSLALDAKRAGKASSRNTGDVAVGKLTEVGEDGQRRFRSKPPLLVPVTEELAPGVTTNAAETFHRYLSTLPADRAVLLLRYSFVDLAHKVVGVGSVGTRALVMLLESGDAEPLILQIKQANQSVLAPYVDAGPLLRGDGEERQEGRRVVAGQQVMQAAGDPFLGWTRGGAHAPYDFYVRQLRDMKGSFDLETLVGDDLTVYGQLCGAVLARAHARAGDASLLSGYLGESDAFDEALGDFALAYADRTDADHAALVTAMRTGEVPTAVHDE